MEERIRFVLEVKDKRRPFTESCRAHGISRKQGYKWWKRFEVGGIAAMVERSRRAHRCPHKTPELWKVRIIKFKKHYGWGGKKLREILLKQYGAQGLPSASTFANILSKEGLVKTRRRRNRHARRALTEHRLAVSSNVVWAVDFKGWFRTGDGRRCDPLTVSDLYSRFVLCCRLVKSQSFRAVQPVFEELFKLYGLPQNIRSDNGSPFGSASGVSQLSSWFLTLGIRSEFIEPGHPEQNGSHERMHRTLKAETTRPAAPTWQAQQQVMDKWRERFNNERPHEALSQQPPVDFYLPSLRSYREKPISYASDLQTRRVEKRGRIKWKGVRYYIGKSLANKLVGIKVISSKRFEVYFCEKKLADFSEILLPRASPWKQKNS
jgi:transposase InsO family protein